MKGGVFKNTDKPSLLYRCLFFAPALAGVFTSVRFRAPLTLAMPLGSAQDEILKAAVMKYGLNQWARISSLLVRPRAVTLARCPLKVLALALLVPDARL